MSSLLPPELWQEVFTCLPEDTTRTCLSVSKVFHDISLRFMFRSVTIFFGAWESAEAKEDVYDADKVILDALEDDRSSMSSAILHRIASDPSFAVIVRSIDVHAYKRDGARGAFERGCLIEAIHCLHNLRSFTWHGSAPRLTPQVIDALISSCTLLRHFSAPLSTLSELPLTKLERLRSIGFTWKWFYDTTRGQRSRLAPESRDLEIRYGDLKELQMPYTSPANIPLTRLPLLTHLELLSIQSLEDFGPIIRRVPQLESLSVFCTRRQYDKLFEALAFLKSDLPNLHSLCLLSRREGALDPAHVQILVDFLKDRKCLRRFRSTFKFANGTHSHFVWAISFLVNLEAVHWDLLSGNITQMFIQIFVQHIPSSMLALSLATAGSLGKTEPFVYLWRHCPDLRFLYIRTWGSEDEPIEQLLEGAKSLQVIGYNGKFYNVKRQDGQLSLSPAWSARKVAFRGLRDFGPGCDSGEWLMRGLRIRNDAEEEAQ
ncbi:uncharacterized protein B0H18DRAFT_1119249 [Fomitopsis serialis]|uniref:uncharacterized protein n=1 Tax=Fomitopsis serialis TaxID=139415 RepID=UPI00200823AB|nr:uncharacterized protein B0H18DRAFT_1119249 [Neoantrodia serialis]KAH9925743.1 hypothetical protein B0H18DRAFT_1119249 [Neoantrodia serialis]